MSRIVVSLTCVVFVFAAVFTVSAGKADAIPPLSDDAVVITIPEDSVLSADSARSVPQRSYGTSPTDISTLSWTEFFPNNSSTGYSGDGTTGYKYSTGPGSFMYAQMPDDIPNGAIINQVVFMMNDSSATDDFTGSLCRYWTDSGTGMNPGSDCLLQLSTSGTPGQGEVLNEDPLEHTVLRRTDADTDGGQENVNYVFITDQGSAFDGSIRIHQVRILWNRSISPAPDTATFPDVDTDHWAFQYIEALVSTGVVSGKPDGLFHPADPITRAEMSKLIADLLGVHWDWSN